MKLSVYRKTVRGRVAYTVHGENCACARPKTVFTTVEYTGPIVSKSLEDYLENLAEFSEKVKRQLQLTEDQSLSYGLECFLKPIGRAA